MFFVKIRTGDNNNWGTYHKSMNYGSNPEQYAMYLDGNSGETDDGWLNDVAPTSSVINLSGGNYGNVNGNTYVAYLWTGKKGFSKFGKYEGNGNSNGTFIYLGFKPAWFLCKPMDASDNWNVFFDDTGVKNTGSAPIFTYANQNFATTTDTHIVDFLSNGVKINASGNTANRTSSFIYAAYATHPFVSSAGIPVTAR